jgi:hypothetical protein
MVPKGVDHGRNGNRHGGQVDKARRVVGRRVQSVRCMARCVEAWHGSQGNNELSLLLKTESEERH